LPWRSHAARSCSSFSASITPCSCLGACFSGEACSSWRQTTLDGSAHCGEGGKWILAKLDEDAELRVLLRQLDPVLRDHLRRVLIRDQADRDAVSSQLLRYRDENGHHWADIIDFLTMNPEARRRVARVLGEIDARG
jgi:hypothetical protein